MMISETTHLKYLPEHCVKILNPQQAAFYLRYGVTLWDMFEDSGKIVFLFDRKESFPWYQRWNQQREEREKDENE